MLVVACVFAGLAALVHVEILVLESLRWEDPATRTTFATTRETATITQPLAYNQGFCNLVLAIGTFVGIALLPSGRAALVQALFPGVVKFRQAQPAWGWSAVKALRPRSLLPRPARPMVER